MVSPLASPSPTPPAGPFVVNGLEPGRVVYLEGVRWVVNNVVRGDGLMMSIGFTRYLRPADLETGAEPDRMILKLGKWARIPGPLWAGIPFDEDGNVHQCDPYGCSCGIWPDDPPPIPA